VQANEMTDWAHIPPLPKVAVFAAAIAATATWGLAPAMTTLAVAEVDAFTAGLVHSVIAVVCGVGMAQRA
jgi:hypothetical protein